MKLINSRDLKAKILDSVFLPDWCRVLVNRVIDSLPAVDAVPVVRCRDCKYYVPFPKCNYGWCNYLWNNANGNSFCSNGEEVNE